MLNKKQSGFATVFILLAVLIIVIGGYLLLLPKVKDLIKSPKTPLPTPTETKKIISLYSDQDLGFEFSYLKNDFKIVNDTEEEYFQRGRGDFRKNFTGYVGYEPPQLVKAVAALTKETNPDQSPFAIWVFENPNNLKPNVWYDKYWYYPFMWGIFDYAHKYMPSVLHEGTVSGQLIEYRRLDYQPGGPEYYYFSQKGKMILVRVLTDKKEGKNILETFKLFN